jgi:hypothetical protein
MSEIHTVSITNDNAKPTDIEKKTTQTPEEYFRAFCTSPLQSIYIYICKNPLTASFVLKYSATFYFLLYHMSSATTQCFRYTRQQLTKNLTMLLFDSTNRTWIRRVKTEIKLWFQKEKNKCYAKQRGEQSISKTEKNYLSKREKQKMWTEQSFWYLGHVQSERDSPTTGETLS